MEDGRNTAYSRNGEANIGAYLERAREERGLTLDEVERATKIRKRYLSGLEREDYDVMPDAVYARGFLKTYANYLGLDGEELSRQLKGRRKPLPERGLDLGPPGTSGFERPLITPGGLSGTAKRGFPGATVLTMILALVALAAVIGALYYVGVQALSVREEPSSEDPPPPRREQEAVAAKDKTPEKEPVAGEGNRGETGSKAGGEAGGEAGSDQGGRSEERPVGAGREDDPSVAPENSLRVSVSVGERPSWLGVTADGSTVYYQVAPAGFTQTFEARRELAITTGDAGAVTVEVNGQDAGPLGEAGQVLTKTFSLKSAS